MRQDESLSNAGPGPQWLSPPEVAEVLSVPHRQVRGMLSDGSLVAVRREHGAGVTIPSTFLIESNAGGFEVVTGLRGTLIQLTDAGLDPDAVVDWLHSANDELGATPIATLRAGSIRAVRRAAQMLAW